MGTYVIEHDEYLEHHGIRGMKWGVRRFQNSDGSLKPAGAKRYGSSLIVSTQKPKLSGMIKKDGYQETKLPGRVIKDGYHATKKPVENPIEIARNVKSGVDFGRKQLKEARKALKKNGSRENYDKTNAEYNKKIQKAIDTDLKNANKKGIDPDSSKAHKLEEKVRAKAEKAVKQALLMDAGMSKQQAQKGAEWLIKKRRNLTFGDTRNLD